jgi:hypothetical protein
MVTVESALPATILILGEIRKHSRIKTAKMNVNTAMIAIGPHDFGILGKENTRSAIIRILRLRVNVQVAMKPKIKEMDLR